MALDNGYVTAEYLKQVAERMRAFKQLSYERMAIRHGDTVLDLGCGPGVDTVPLATLVGDSGKVIGIDSDEGMLAKADAAALEAQCQQRVEHRVGSAAGIPLADNAVASCRAERLLQVLVPELEQTVIGEMIRVTRPGGRIVLADTDWSSASVDFSDIRLERRLMKFFALRMRPNGLAGRRLQGLCRDRQLEDIRIDVIPMLQQRLEDTPFGDWLINTARGEGIINEAEAQQWKMELQRREQQQCFYACVNMVIASGSKPGVLPE
jgi:ubiquinone/menaquinone biosynthesis C-methylase UbiE